MVVTSSGWVGAAVSCTNVYGGGLQVAQRTKQAPANAMHAPAMPCCLAARMRAAVSVQLTWSAIAVWLRGTAIAWRGRAIAWWCALVALRGWGSIARRRGALRRVWLSVALRWVPTVWVRHRVIYMHVTKLGAL